MSLISISQKKTCSHIKCVQRYFRSEAGNLKVCYRMQVRENSVNEDHHVTVQILLSNCEAKRDIVTVVESGLCRGKSDLDCGV